MSWSCAQWKRVLQKQSLIITESLTFEYSKGLKNSPPPLFLKGALSSLGEFLESENSLKMKKKKVFISL